MNACSDDVNYIAKQENIPSLGAIKKPTGLGVRHAQILMIFAGLMLSFALKTNLSIGIVAMVDNSSNTKFQEFDWNESRRGLILSSLYWGLAVSPFPSGLLAQRFGPKILFTISSAICSILTLTLPITASFGWGYVCTSRVILGFFQGCYYPCIHSLLAKWVHPSEQGILSALTYAAPSAGIVIMMSVSGTIALSSIGWPGIFYTSGLVSAIWSVVWAFYGSNSPAQHKTISIIERTFIESSNGSSKHRSFSTPWKQIFASPPFWALLIAYSTQSWSFLTFLAVIPSYMNGVLHFDMNSNAMFSALPYLATLAFVLIFIFISDYLITHKTVSVGFCRKMFNTVGMWTPAMCLIGLGFVTQDNATWAVVLLTILMGVNSGVIVGHLINHIDLSPNFAGTLMGITDSIGSTVCLLGPLFVGFVVYDMADPDLWKIFFFLTAAFFFLGNIMFIILGEATIQVWNDWENKDREYKRRRI